MKIELNKKINSLEISKTCETSSSSAVGGSLPLFMILVTVLIVEDE
jgi:hypothetical protein